MLMALLLPDPCDTRCPDEFKNRARRILPRVQGTPGEKDIDLRDELLRFIGDFADWDNAASHTFLDAARGLVRAAHGEEAPLVVDPFAGGGAIPLEALRVGCDAFASDLNPVASLILKAVLEDIPRYGPALADRLRSVGLNIKSVAEKRLSDFYPRDPDGATPIAYLWARTVQCDTCGADIPLSGSFWLCKKSKRKRALRYSVVRPRGTPPRIEFEVFQPKKDSEVPAGTISRAKATCPCCNVVMHPDRVRLLLQQQNGGADVKFDPAGKRIGGATLLAVATLKVGAAGRSYRTGVARDYDCIFRAEEALKAIAKPTLEIEQPLPAMTGTFNAPLYGMVRWSLLFTARQKLALLSFANIISSLKDEAEKELSSFALSKLADLSNSLCMWEPIAECPRHLFGRQAIPMSWDFAEGIPIGESSGSFAVCVENTATGVSAAFVPLDKNSARVQVADATASPLPAESADVWFTDPPYYFAVPYAELSDFFFVWLKQALPSNPLLHDPFDSNNHLTPKKQELCEMAHWDSERYGWKDKTFFEEGMRKAFAQGRLCLAKTGIGCVVFAHKTTEGWEALLSGIIGGKWVVTGSWPIATEMGSRLRARESAALATSVHLVCRPRSEHAGIGDWADVLRELPQRIGEWIERLQPEGVRGADLVFACIGPAMEIYSRYRRVEDAEGREIPLGGDPTASEPYKRGFLAYVWETVGRLALEQVLGTAEARARNGAAGALEEDSRLTALFLWTLQTTEAATNGDDETVGEQERDEEEGDEETPKKKKIGFTLIYDVARRFAQPLGIHLDRWEGRIIETAKGVVRLLPVSERALQLFGDIDASAISRRIEQDVKASRNYEFAFMQDVAAPPEIKPRGRRAGTSTANVAESATVQTVTTLDRVHAAMLLQASGQANGLRAMLKEEQQRGPDFLRLANALSALYPKNSEEKRLLDAMLLAVPRN
jgi:hypothetical protein